MTTKGDRYTAAIVLPDDVAKAAGLALKSAVLVTEYNSFTWLGYDIRPVAEGGGQCDLDNLRTLCLPCHREVTAQLRLRLRSTRPDSLLEA